MNKVLLTYLGVEVEESNYQLFRKKLLDDKFTYYPDANMTWFINLVICAYIEGKIKISDLS